MTQVQLPSHLANRQVRSLTERAAEGMGSSLPPHISIQGNSFTFIDAAGNEYQPVLTFDAAIVDVSDFMNKRYYDKPFDPNASTYEPPVCWSANGIAPSREATKPQAPTCDGCQFNERGSAISRISGSAIKACRDERWIALLVPQMPQMIFQLVITPGSFKNWKAYTETFRNYGVELSFGLTRFSFVPKTNGVLMFEHVGWVDEPTVAAVEAANRENKTDAIVGRTDQPRVVALAPPAQQAQIAHQTPLPTNQIVQQPVNLGGQHQVAQQEIIPPTAQVQQPGPFVPMHAPSAATPGPSAPSVAQSAGTTSPSDQSAPRRRRTKAEMAAAGAPQVVQQPSQQVMPGTFVPATAPQQAPAVPFPMAAAAPATTAQFGMAPGAPVNAEMEAMLKSMGFTRQSAA